MFLIDGYAPGKPNHPDEVSEIMVGDGEYFSLYIVLNRDTNTVDVRINRGGARDRYTILVPSKELPIIKRR